MKRPILLLLLSIVLVFGMMPVSVMASATDARICADLGALKGEGDGITAAYLTRTTERYQAVVIMARLLGMEDEIGDMPLDAPNFTDANGRSEYVTKVMAFAKANPELGFIGFADGSFRPEEAVTAQQIYKVLLVVLGHEEGEDFTWSQVFSHAEDNGLSKLQSRGVIENARLATAILEAMNAEMADGSETLASNLVGEGVIDEEGAKAVGVLGGELLKSFTLAGSFEDNVINNHPVDADCSSRLWNSDTEKFEPVATAAENIVGNFVRLWDLDGDGKADRILIVSREDSEDFWNSDMHWYDDFDDEGAYSDEAVWRVPFGERLLVEYGPYGAIEDYSNLVDYADLAGSAYWPLHDYYKATSSDTLTMLTGFGTTQQGTGWACGPTSAIMVLDWFGLRGDLNEQDLAALRQKPPNPDSEWDPLSQGGATNLQQMVNIFEGLHALNALGKGEWGEWEIDSSYTFAEAWGLEKPDADPQWNPDGKYDLGSLYEADEWEDWMDGTKIQEYLEAGVPVIIGWNSFGGHWQVIIGYDDMGTEDTKDDVLILADPYDSTDHRNDGYNIQSLERFVWDWSAGFDPDFQYGIFVAAKPVDWDYAPTAGEGITAHKSGYDGNDSDDQKLPYGRTAADIEKYYAEDEEWRGENGLSAAATGGYEREDEHVNVSPYYAHYDFYNWESGDSPVSDGELIILEGFKTQQQTTEWTCGVTSALMALEWFGANPGMPSLLDIYSDADFEALAKAFPEIDVDGLYDDRLTEINLALLRGEGREEPGATTLDDLKNIFENLNANEEYLNALARAHDSAYLLKWEYLTTDDLEEDDGGDLYWTDPEGEERYLVGGSDDDGLIPYALRAGGAKGFSENEFSDKGYPVLIGWSEWGGHWQVVIGYDDMGTEETPDDILILADPYDTTDHNQDGYYLEAFERLVYGWTVNFDYENEYTGELFFIPYLVVTDIAVN